MRAATWQDGAALAAVAVTLGLAAGVVPLTGRDPAGLPIVATLALVAWYGGWGPRLLAAPAGLGGTVPAPKLMPAAPLAPVATEAAAAGPLRLLVVEDDAATARLMLALLRRRQHEVAHADSVAAALALDVARFDLLLCDIGLPDGDGRDLLRRLRPRTTAPAIAISGFADPEDARLSREAGFLAHLPKPVDIPALEALITRVGCRQAAGARA